MTDISALFSSLEQVKHSDKQWLKKRLFGAKKLNEEKQAKVLVKIAQDIEKSITHKQVKLANLPKVEYPEDLPVSQNAAAIAKTINDNQVVIIAGETGSGKTTQIPKNLS